MWNSATPERPLEQGKASFQWRWEYRSGRGQTAQLVLYTRICMLACLLPSSLAKLPGGR